MVTAPLLWEKVVFLESAACVLEVIVIAVSEYLWRGRGKFQ
jgi:hypothetical protein